MALINCEECKKEVSDKAASCPNCGAPLQATTAKQSLWDSVSQRSGPKEVVVRGTDVGYEAQKATEGILVMVMALFLHPVFAFLGFWIICTGLLLSMAPLLNLDELPNWYTFTAMGISVALAVAFRKFVPRIMKWIFLILVGVLALAFVGGIISAIIERSASG